MIVSILFICSIYSIYKFHHKEKVADNWKKKENAVAGVIGSGFAAFFFALWMICVPSSTKEEPVGYIAEKAFSTVYVSTHNGHSYSSTKPYDALVWSANKHKGYEIIRYNMFGYEVGRREFKAVYNAANLK